MARPCSQRSLGHRRKDDFSSRGCVLHNGNVSRWAIGVAVGLVVCGACGRQPPRLRPLGPHACVVAFGDSLTSGVGVRASETYPALLARALGCEVINAGVAGETSDAALRRLPGVLESYRPDLVILCHGGNDFLQRRPESAVATNVARMIETIRSHGADVVLVSVPRAGLILRAAPFYARLARRYGVPCEDHILAQVLSTPALKEDAIHPNAQGNLRLAEALARLIRESTSSPLPSAAPRSSGLDQAAEGE